MFLLLTTLLGCAERDEELERRLVAYELELEALRETHAEELEDLQGQLAVAKDEAETRSREVHRIKREVSAVRVSHNAEKASLDAALDRLREREEEVARLKKQLDSGQAGAQAAELMRDLAQQNQVLREELAKAIGGRREPGEDLSGLIRPSHVDLDAVVATIDDTPLRRREFIEFLYLDVGSAGFLDLFINRYLLLREGERRGLSVSDVDAETWVGQEMVTQAAAAGSPKAFEEKLKERGFTADAWEARLRYQARPAILLRGLVELDRQTPAGRQAFEERLRAAYTANYSAKVSASHIFIPLAQGADEEAQRAALRLIQAAEKDLQRKLPFEEVVRRYSRDEGSRQLRGSLGAPFGKDRFAELPRLNAVLFGLAPGKTSPIVRSRIGLHLVRVDSRHEPKRAYGEVRAELARSLRAEPPSNQEIEVLLRRLRAGARIETNLTFDDD